MQNLAAFIKYHRKQAGFSQEDLATKAGVGLRFIREMEQGKETLQLDKVEQVLNLFGFELSPAKQQTDAYDIYWNYTNKAVKITLADKKIKYGIIIKELLDKKENKIIAWQFVPNKNAIKYQQKPDNKLTETILNSDINSIEEQ